MEQTLVTLVMAVGGVLLLVIFTWSWRGASPRARWWHRDNHGSDSMAMGVIPGTGLILVGVAALRTLPDAVSGVALALITVGGIVVVIGAVVPRLWGPRWYRDYLARQKRRARRR